MMDRYKKLKPLPVPVPEKKGFCDVHPGAEPLPERTERIEPLPNADGTMPRAGEKQRGYSTVNKKKTRQKMLKENPPKNIYDIIPSKVQNLWERLPHENERDYAAFYTFLQLGPNRTIRAVADKLNGSPVDDIPAWIYEASQKNNWDERIIAYDRYMQRLEDEQVAKVRKDNARRNAELLTKFESLIEREVNAYLKKAEKTPDDQPLLTAAQLTNMNEMLVSMRKLNEDYRKMGDRLDMSKQRKVVFHVVNVSTKDIKKDEPKKDANVIDIDFTPVEDVK